MLAGSFVGVAQVIPVVAACLLVGTLMSPSKHWFQSSSVKHVSTYTGLLLSDIYKACLLHAIGLQWNVWCIFLGVSRCLAACHLEGILQPFSILHYSSPGWWSSGSGSFNISAFAGLFAVATIVGAVLLTDAVDFGEVGVKEGVNNANAQLQQLTASPRGGNCKILLEVGLGLFG